MSTQTITIGVVPNRSSTSATASASGTIYTTTSGTMSVITSTGALLQKAGPPLPLQSHPNPAKSTEYTVVRKKQRLTPLGESNVSLNAANVKASGTPVVRKTPGPKRPRVTHQTPHNAENVAPASAQPKPIGQLKTNTSSSSPTANMPPISVARRNARERNRVKQVNNGFSALRDRIPDEVAEIFEAHGTGRGSVKKLSKVETLRMAVEYIRSLEQCLVDDGVVLPEPQEMQEMGDAEFLDFSALDYGGATGGSDDNNNAASSPPEMLLEETLMPEDGDAVGSSFLDTSSSTGSSYSGRNEFIRLPAGGSFQISTPIYERDENGVMQQHHQYAGVPIVDATTGIVHHPPAPPKQQQQHRQLQQQQLQQQIQQHQLQLQLQQNAMLMSPAASISPQPPAFAGTGTADSSPPSTIIKSEDCFVILPPSRDQRDQLLQLQQLQQMQHQQLLLQQAAELQMAADGTLFYAGLMEEESLSPVPAMYALKTELTEGSDGGSDQMLLSEQEQADSMIGTSLEWWQRSEEQQKMQ